MEYLWENLDVSDSAIHQFDYLPRYIDVLEAFLSAQYVIKVFFFFACCHFLQQ